MSAYLFRMLLGFVGQITRQLNSRIEMVVVAASPVPFGAPVGLDTTGKLTDIVANIVSVGASKIFGVLTLSYPQPAVEVEGKWCASGNAQVGVLKSGYITIKLPTGESPKKGGIVYVMPTTVGTPVYIFTSNSAAVGAVALDAYFEGETDGSGKVEIAYNV